MDLCDCTDFFYLRVDREEGETYNLIEHMSMYSYENIRRCSRGVKMLCQSREC